MLSSLQIHSILSMPYQQNTFILRVPGSPDVTVIDPGLQPELILNYLQSEKLNVVSILNTHGHGDHIGGNQAMRDAFPDAPIWIGKGDAHMLTDPTANLSASFGHPLVSPAADRLLEDGETVETAGITFDIMEIPGHSPGHVVFIYKSSPAIVIGGDVLFKGSIGRFDFPGCDGELLVKGIKEKLFQLPDETIVHPGHGPETTIGEEKLTNPYVGEGAIFDLGGFG